MMAKTKGVVSERWQKLNRLYFAWAEGLFGLGYQDDGVGLRQFIDLDSHGVKPSEPDAYFTLLLNGKASFNWQKTGMRDTYFGVSESGVELFRWPGLFALWCDWAGERWMLRELIDWYPVKLPDSFFAEGNRFPIKAVTDAQNRKVGLPPTPDDFPEFDIVED
jgi:hypothetical protein